MPVTRILVLLVMLVLLAFMVQTWNGVSRYSGWKSPLARRCWNPIQ